MKKKSFKDCIKCGENNPLVTYQPAEKRLSKNNEERMALIFKHYEEQFECQCSRCDFTWEEEVLPTKTNTCAS